MTGNNKIHMNDATMIEAMPYYLNHVVLKTSCKVNSVGKDNSTSGGFLISLVEANPVPAASLYTGDIK